MPGSKKKTRTARILSEVGKELKDNPPSILAETQRKQGAKKAGKQRVAILLDKARDQGARIKKKRAA